MLDAKDLSVPFGTRHCSSRRARIPAGFASIRVMLLVAEAPPSRDTGATRTDTNTGTRERRKHRENTA